MIDFTCKECGTPLEKVESKALKPFWHCPNFPNSCQNDDLSFEEDFLPKSGQVPIFLESFFLILLVIVFIVILLQQH